MVVYIILASHSYEGIEICGVFNDKPSQRFAKDIAAERSVYEEEEFYDLVEVAVEEYPLEKLTGMR